MAIASLGFQAFSAISEANAKKTAAREDARQKNLQADELLYRLGVNEEITREEGQFAISRFGAQAAATGFADTGVGGAIRIKSNIERSLANQRHAVEYQARMLRMGANIDTRLAGDLGTAGYLSAAGTVLGGGAQLGYQQSQLGKPGSAKKLEYGSSQTLPASTRYDYLEG